MENNWRLIVTKETNSIGDNICFFRKVNGNTVVFNDDGETLENLELSGLTASERKRITNAVTQNVYYGKGRYKCRLTPDNELEMFSDVNDEEEIQWIK